MFDRDFPGHYFRTIKSISISIPAVVGPYQTFRATLTQTSNKTLLAPVLQGVQYLMGDSEQSPTTVRADFRANQQIAISTGVEDSGMFELNFGDGRYLPFEGTGAVSTWLLEMPKATNPIDFDSITDVIIHLRYTSKSDTGLFKSNVMNLEAFKAYQGLRLVSIAHEFAAAWHSLNSGALKTPIEIPLSNVTPSNVQVDPSQVSIPYLYNVKEDGSLTEVTNLFNIKIPDTREQKVEITIKDGQNTDRQKSPLKDNPVNLLVLLSFAGQLKTL